MALYATNRFPGDGVTTSYEFNFTGKYITRQHVKVYQEDNVTGARTPVVITDSNFLNDTTLHNLPVTPAGSTLVIYRDTPKLPLVDFTNGARLTEASLDTATRQGAFIATECADALSTDGVAGVFARLEDLSGQAAASASAASVSAAVAELAKDDAIAAASAIGPVKFYGTKAQADAAIGTMADGDLLEVAVDETRANARTRYEVQAGVLVFVVNLDQVRLDLAAATGASRVGFIQAGTGAVNRTVQDRLREVYNVKDYGATGDGATDDTTALTNAYNACPAGGCLVFPAGTYVISSTLVVTKNDLLIMGQGLAFLKKKTGAANMDALRIDASHCTVRDLQVNGNHIGFSGIVIRGSFNRVVDCRSFDNGGCGILLDGQTSTCQYNTVESCVCTGNDEIGISQNTALASRILGNICQDNNLEGITIDLPSYRSIVDGNQVIGNCRTGGVGGIGIDQAYLTVISNNLVSGTMSAKPGLTFQCNVGDTTYCTVTGNIFVDNANGGIWLKKTGAYYSGFNVIDGNIFLNNGGKSITIDAGCNNNILGNNQYQGVWPADSGENNRKSAGSVFFRVANNTVRSNVTGDGTWYSVPFEVEQADPENCVAAGVFTAPTKGLYSFQAAVRMAGGASHTWAQLSITSVGGASYSAFFGVEVGAESVFPLAGATTFQLMQGDTVRVDVRVGGGTKTLRVEASVNECWFTGHLIG